MLKSLMFLCLLIASSTSTSKGIAAPIGLEIGKATCADVEARLPKSSVRRGTSVWSFGPTLVTSNVRALELEGLEEVLAVCAKDDGRVLALVLTFSKGGVGTSQVRETARQLDAKYRSVRRDLPPVGNAFAQWSADNSVIELDAPHMSFSFALTYWTSEGAQMYRRFREVEARRQESKKAGSL